MRLGENQKLVLEILQKEGVVENLGNTYRNFAKSAKQTTNKTILNFVEKVKEFYPEASLTIGPRGGLGTATLRIR
ncbi:TPA: hypothetical protein LA742_001223 [Clostridium botulinum]|uniref:hypothetical protein n=1 Tax=Clostridium sporogenes TaxID=1509 RepID=UPI000772D6B7|nr:hypothetical protein [Clostridium sporogenes]AUM93719.1 hypothetical protein RSJ11_00445 [Clostridium sporogenes]HBJ2612790.1 hypothetical protein [Clostridium botulinum]